MSDGLRSDEVERLQRYVPPSWREEGRLCLTPETLAECNSHLQALRTAVSTYLPWAIQAGDRGGQVGRGEFRYGTALFVDVSGFSTLTERFSRECGHEGAEEVTFIVNHFLDGVNVIAMQYGGDLLKFAGDACLSFYEGPDHAARACRAAWEMQQTVRERFTSVETSLGRFALQVSVGLGSGWVFTASLGTPDNAEYVVMGPALAAMGRAEQLAQAGQVFVDRVTCELAGETITGIPRVAEGFFELRQARPCSSAMDHPRVCPSPPNGSPYTALRSLLTQIDALVPYLPPGLLDKLVPSPEGTGSIESDHRWVTTLFADLRGANGLVEALGPEREDLLTEVLNRQFLAMRGVVERYEGVLHKVGAGPTGPHLFITFGAPKSHPDDPERAIRAGLDMQESLADVNREVETLVGDTSGVQFPLFRQAIGVTTGFVFAGSVGSAERREYTVMGDVVNLACRLMTAAAEGELLAADSTVRYLGERFEYRLRPAIRVKGKHEPVSYAQVTGLVQLPPLLEVAKGSLVGRWAELDVAQVLLSGVTQGAGGVLVVSGEAGMGKSRLAQEIAQQAQKYRMRVLAGACLSYGGDIPYLPWTDVMRALLRVSATEHSVQLQQLARGLTAGGMAGWEPLVAELLELETEETELTASLDPRLRQQRLFDIVLQLIRYYARAQPLLLVVEDVHWADPTSLELLDYVARNVASCSAVLMILHRPREWLDGRWQKFTHATEIMLRELPDNAIQALVADILGGGNVPERLVDLVLHKAQGNPFFTEEVLRALIDAEVLRRDDERWQLAADPDRAGVPDTIHGVIQSRIDRLEETERRVLQVASVIGRTFGVQVLDGVYPYDDLDGTLPRCLGRLGTVGLVLLEVPEPEPIYMFRHALTQDVAYESLSYARRRELHRRVGEFIEVQGGETLNERPGFLAHHFFQGRAWHKALHYSLAAGRKAQREYANEVAVAHFERSLQSAAELDEPPREERLEAYEALGEVLTIAGRYDEALSSLDAARALIEAGPPAAERERRLAALYRRMAEAYEPRGDYEAALEWLKRGLSVIGITDAVEGARLYRMGAGVFHRQGENELASEWCEKSLEIAERLGDEEALARGNSTLGAILHRRGNVDAVIAHCQRSLEIYQARGNLLGQFKAHNNLAMAYDDQDAWELAGQHYAAARGIAERVGYAEGQAMVASNLGEIYLVQGRLAAARKAYQTALEIAERWEMAYGMALLHNNLGAVSAREGDWEQAKDHLERSMVIFEEIGSEDFLAELYRHKAEVAFGQDRLVEAAAYADRSLQYAQAHGLRLEEGRAWLMVGRMRRELGASAPAEQSLARALEIADEVGNRYEAALARLEMARLRVRQGKVEEGMNLARQAGQVFAQLGARLDMKEAKALLSLESE
ncbi:MAG: tetratricopeptide repeat protein [Chloroflexota bacterium]|nr:tetratricopeptide repeat protein [Chloroflexota bacterium]